MQAASLPDCLIVLDTLGLRPSSAILGITALRFDLDEPSLAIQQLSLSVDPDSNHHCGRTFGAGTLAFWVDRPNMRDVFTREGMPIAEALGELAWFVADVTQLWTTGSGFESAVLSDAYERLHMSAPWPHWIPTCARTMCSLAAWLDGHQVPPTAEGIDSVETAHLRVADLRFAYSVLKSQRKNRRVSGTGTYDR